MEGAAGPYPTMTNGVPIVTAFAYGKYLGEVELTFDDDGQRDRGGGATDPAGRLGGGGRSGRRAPRRACGALDEVRQEVVA